MRNKLINLVKYNKVILFVYRFFGNVFIKLLSVFVRVNNKKILFMSFGGRKYDDSPKALYETVKKDLYFKDFEFVWAFRNPSEFCNLDCKTVKTDTFRFYLEALSARTWINNSSVERGLKVRRNNTIEFNTWHGTPLKKIGKDINNDNSFGSIIEQKGIQYYCAQSEFDRDIFCRFFDTTKDFILLSDLPRNDILLKCDEAERKALKLKFGIPEDKKVLLYMPTFREFDKDGNYNCYINPPIDLDKWKERLGAEYVVLFRAHYEVVKILGIEETDFIKNVSNYPTLSDLMLLSDILVSDYSSVYFDYSIMEKPMFNFAYDYEAYCAFRGLYLDIEKDMGMKINKDEDSLMDEILSFDYDNYVQKTIRFKNTFCPYAGNASNVVVEKIKEVIEGEVEK